MQSMYRLITSEGDARKMERMRLRRGNTLCAPTMLRILVNTNQARETGRTKFIDRHCLQSMRSRFYVTLGCPSVGTSHQSTSAAAWGRFAAERRASRSYRSTAADA